METSNSVEQEKKEKLIQKMSEVLQNKNNLVQQMLDKLRDHVSIDVSSNNTKKIIYIDNRISELKKCVKE